jgi:hypothetical protein
MVFGGMAGRLIIICYSLSGHDRQALFDGRQWQRPGRCGKPKLILAATTETRPPSSDLRFP